MEAAGGQLDLEALAAASAGSDDVHENVYLWENLNVDMLRRQSAAEDLLEPMAFTANSASYWGDHGQDVDARTERERLALIRIIRAALDSPAMDWWSASFDASCQSIVINEHSWPQWDRPPLYGSALRLADWGQERVVENLTGTPSGRASDEAGGQWWCTPGWGAPTSTRPLGPLPALALEVEEDGFGPRPSHLLSIHASRALRIFEIDGPDDWLHLVRQYTLDVTGQMRGSWWSATWIDDAWFIPDWAAVAADFDVVHLTGMGYLTTAGRALQVGKGHTLMAGFSPDWAYWLTDSFSFPDDSESWNPDSSR